MSYVSRFLVAGVLVAAVVPVGVAAGAHTSSSGTRVSLRVEGLGRTLVSPTKLVTRSRAIDPDGRPADTCTGNTAAVALQDATHGQWTAGKYSASLGYPVVGIKGESHPFTSSYYWSLWVNGQAATSGICGATLHAGDRILFFAQCLKSTAGDCPNGLFNPPVLDLSGPGRARHGQVVRVTVRSLDNASGKPSPASSASVRYAGKTTPVDGRGQARLLFAHRGRYLVSVTAPNSVRDETTIVVR